MLSENLYGKNKKLLELNTRKKIYLLVKKYSGCHLRELERLSKLPLGTLKHHLDYLTKYDLILRDKQGSNLRYFSSDLEAENSHLLGVLRQKSLRDIILSILAHGNCTHKFLVTSTHLSPSTISWHLKKLLREKILKLEEKTYALLIPEEAIVKLLITYKESFLDSLVNQVIDMWEVR
jgi:predicted transcriptional regulator